MNIFHCVEDGGGRGALKKVERDSLSLKPSVFEMNPVDILTELLGNNTSWVKFSNHLGSLPENDLWTVLKSRFLRVEIGFGKFEGGGGRRDNSSAFPSMPLSI